MGRKWETSQEMVMAWTGGSSGEFKKWSDSGYIVKGRLTGFAGGPMSSTKEREAVGFLEQLEV